MKKTLGVSGILYLAFTGLRAFDQNANFILRKVNI
jgi:hypothetical protein